MKMVVDSRSFAECMKKISPAVEAVKEKKDAAESAIQLMITNQKHEEGYFGIAVAFDGCKQLFCMFCASELEMEEERKDIYISGKRLCDVCVALDNGRDIPMTLEIDKYCLIKKGGSQVQIPLCEKPVIIYPGNDWYTKTSVHTKDLLELLSKGGRFYSPNVEGMIADVCLCFDTEKKKIYTSSTDGHKLGLYELGTKFEKSDLMKKLLGKTDGEEVEVPPTFNMENQRLKLQVAGEHLKILSRFLDPRVEETEVCVFEKYIYFKCAADIAFFMLKDVSEKAFAFEATVQMAENHSKTGCVHMAPQDILDALNVFDVANQGDEPNVYISKDKGGMLRFSTKGKVSKTNVQCEIEGEFKDMVLNSILFRQVINNYAKTETITLYGGGTDEPVLIAEKGDLVSTAAAGEKAEKSESSKKQAGDKDYCILSKIGA